MPEYLVEYYKVNPETQEKGWDTGFLWVTADNCRQAREQAKSFRNFDKVIQITGHTERFLVW